MTIFLVRHATASVRTVSTADIRRPLDDHGHEQAEELRRLLMDRRIDRILSSPATRCQQTVAPLAASLGLTVESCDELWEGHGGSAAFALVQESVESGQSVVLCSHGDVIPAVLQGLQMEGMSVGGRGGCAKGSCWEIDVEDGRPVLGRYHELHLRVP